MWNPFKKQSDKYPKIISSADFTSLPDRQNLQRICKAISVLDAILSIGTTFCLWTTENEPWKTGQIETYNDCSREMLKTFDGDPESGPPFKAATVYTCE